jgi:putative SOS response-associated peptidase YedK
LSASRAVVPCNGFYEFRKHAGRSLPYLISTGTLLYLAAIAFMDQGFVIVTTKPSKQLAELHQRSPLILSGPDQARSWLSNASFAQFDLPEITSLSVRPVDPLLNDPARKDRKLLEAPRYEQGTLL